MFPQVNTREPAAVAAEVQAILQDMYSDADPQFVSRSFDWAVTCFTGHYRNYQPIDARYHDFEHTLQGALCLMRILHGRHLLKAKPRLPQRLFELSLLAILLHDTGYLKTRDDTEGTGAKYTFIHVDRSAAFADALLEEKGYGAFDILCVQNMIRCTGVNADLSTIPFQDDIERMAGFALATADLLGQMAADDYLEKLPILYLEFEECQRFQEGKVPPRMKFNSVDDLLKMTPVFWEKYVQRKINVDFHGLYHFLNRPVPDGPNWYIQRIEANLDRLKHQLNAAA